MNSAPRILRPGPRRQRGVVLIFALISLVILLIGAVAMMNSMNASLFNAGNYGFKRDLTNQGERALNTVIGLISTGALGTEAAREANNNGANYRASMLASDPQGIPLVLQQSDAAFAASGFTAPAIVVNDQGLDMGVTVRYVIDRMCVNAGAVDKNSCTTAGTLAPTGGTPSPGGTAEDTALPVQAVYRVTIRVTGPRNTQSFFQATITG